MRVEIARLADTAVAQQCAHMMATSEPWVTLQRDYETALTILEDPARECYVAYGDGAVAGFIILVMQGAFVEYIQSICVDTAVRGQVIGQQLMAFAEERIFRNAPNVFICVSSFNPRAQRLYQQLGYTVVGELTDYIVPGHSEILLRKSIAPLIEFSV